MEKKNIQIVNVKVDAITKVSKTLYPGSKVIAINKDEKFELNGAFEITGNIAPKPPRGIMPKEIWLEKRHDALGQAIERYLAADRNIPLKWIEEYNDLKQVIKESINSKKAMTDKTFEIVRDELAKAYAKRRNEINTLDKEQ